MINNWRDVDELVFKIETRWSNIDILKMFKVLRCYLGD